MERRAGSIELRTKGRRLEGYAAIFDTETPIADFREVIRPGAFGISLAKASDILALVDHDPTRVLARTRSGTLRLNEDGRGLAFDLKVPDTSAGRDVLALAERGDLGGASIGFAVKEERWANDLRELHALDLLEISVVAAWPAYPATTVAARGRPQGMSLRLARRYVETLE